MIFCRYLSAEKKAGYTLRVPFILDQEQELIRLALKTIKSTLTSGDDVLVSGFGKFCVNEKRERRSRNPATGDSMMLRPRKVVTFKCSGKLRRKINGI